MHPALIRAWSRVERGRADVIARIGRHSAEARAFRPGSGSWSLDEIVEHLVLVERGIASALAKEPTPDRPRIVKPGRWLRWPIMRLVLGAGIKIRAPSEAILPTGRASFEVLVAEWEADQTRFRTGLEGAPEALFGDPRFRHPIAGWLTIPQAVIFAGDHLRHHLPQIKRGERALTMRS